MKKLLNLIKRYFLSGVLVVVPFIITVLVLKFLFQTIDGVLSPLIERLFGFYIPGLGLLATILLIFTAGILTRNFLGNQFYRVWEAILAKLPLIRPIYSSVKQLLEAMTSSGEKSFDDVVIVEYPRKGIYSIGFVTNRMEMTMAEKTSRLISVFIPSTPTPLSGMIILVPSEDVTVVDISIEDGIKFIVSGGVAAPRTFRARENAEALGTQSSSQGVRE
ncbi:MAG: DUF502 domain-containing protein [candidate division Zixibacteria bacterium]|nr:DUF502 domain-containing protein [candidate division Zixibacteria bacterium]